MEPTAVAQAERKMTIEREDEWRRNKQESVIVIQTPAKIVDANVELSFSDGQTAYILTFCQPSSTPTRGLE